MDTLKNLYQELCQTEDENKTCFYYSHISAQDAKSFIKYYFEAGHKKLDEDILEKLSIMRFEHMRSAFLLGVYLYNELDSLRQKINNKIEEYKNKLKEQDLLAKKLCEDNLFPEEKGFYDRDTRKTFLYLWFITCLYHDVGYIYEESKNKDTQEYDKKYKIIKEEKYEEICNNPLIMINNNIPCLFIKSYKQYFHVKLCSNDLGNNCIDHAIAGGLRLYEALRKKHYEYINPKNEHKKEMKSIFKNGICDLLWGPPIFDNFIIPCVENIIAHNIWFSLNNNDDEKYNQLGLEALIIPKDDNGERKSPVTYKDYSLLFLLDLVDTIEPIKYWSRHFHFPDYTSIIDKTKIDIQRNIIKYSFENFICCNVEEAYNNIKNNLEFLYSDSFRCDSYLDHLEMELIP